MNLYEAFAAALDDMNTNDTASHFRQRPYDGQPWTGDGIRGSTEVKGLTVRDIRDCFVRAYIMSHNPDLGNNRVYYEEALKGTQASLRASDMFALTGEIDPVAVSQNLTCEIERVMGIFPNIGEIKHDSETGLPEGTSIYKIDNNS